MKYPSKLTAAMLLTAGMAPLGAQTTAPAQPAPAAEEDTIVLTPFEVTAEKNRGYQATETLAGTRIRTELKDVGSAISVVTKEFMQDIGATDNTTLLQYTNNTEVGGIRSTYTGLGNGTTVSELATLGAPSFNNRVRGLSAADNTRDFFVSDIPWDSYNVDRIDIQRGPNSILFGLGKPAGIINASTKNAEYKNIGEVVARFGSWGSKRASLGLNQELIKKTLALRVDGLWNHEKFRQKPSYSNDERVSAAVRFDPKLINREGFHTSIRGKFEHGEIESNRPRTVTPNDFISPFFRASTDTWGGLNRQTFDPYDVENQQKIAGDNKGQARQADPEYNAWVAASGNQQQSIYFIDGMTGTTSQIYGGYINRLALSPTGTTDGTITAIPFSDIFLSVQSLSQYATNMKLPGYQFGQYRQNSLLDRSVFDFYNNLIDGPNKKEWSDWDAYNVSFSQTGFNDRVGVDVNFDRQTYHRGQYSLFGNPGINIDLLKRFQDFKDNPNVGRPYIMGAGNSGGFSYDSKRTAVRASLFAELRADDVLSRDSLLARILGRHRLNGVYAGENYESENRQWQNYAAGSTFDVLAFGSAQGFIDRPPQAVVYLGSSLLSRTTASGANISRVLSDITLNDGKMYYFLGQYNNTSVAPSAAWNRAGDAVWGQFAEGSGTTQSENPANYVGWNSNFDYDVLRYSDGNANLLTSANKAQRKVSSYAGTWQSYFWDGAFVGTIGWRFDTVKSKEVNGQKVASNRGIINLDPYAYQLPALSRVFKDHSLSWGGVLHLNKLTRRDFLPINISLAYNRSSNFEVAGARTDIYGTALNNPTGKTKDYGIRLATKDDKYSLRVTKYEAEVKDGTSSSFNSAYLGGVLARGLAWANVFEYNFGNGGYTMAFANVGDPGRYTYAPAPGETQADADRREAAAIAAWRDLANKVDQRIFTVWGIDKSQIYNYVTTVSQPGSFAITEDTKSKGTEFEFTANPTKNWRISANASETEAFRTNIGGQTLKEYIALIDNYMNNTAAGDLRVFFGNPDATTMRIQWNSNFSGGWALKKIQEGSAVPEIRKWRYNITNNYNFTTGRLKGFNVGASYRWEDKVVIGYPVLTDSAGNGTFDLTKPYYGPSEDAVDLWVGYERKLTSRINWRVQFNVRNAFAKDGLVPISVQPDGKTWASVRITPDREWFLTNTFTF